MSVAWHGGSIVAGFKGEYALVRHESGGGESTHTPLTLTLTRILTL